MIYDDMTELELLIDDFLHIVHTDDGQKRMDMSGPFIRKLNLLFDKESD